MEGIKSIDFKIKASGSGVVNSNGPTALTGDSGKTVDNHNLPKLRGFTPFSGKVKEETGYQYRKHLADIDLSKTPMYVSQNCIRHFLFIENAYDLHFATEKNADQILASTLGLLRGYLIPSCGYVRKSPMRVLDFIDQLGNGNFEQMTRSGERDSTSIFSKTTFGDTEYIGYASLNLEELQFISTDKKFGRAAIQLTTKQVDPLLAKINHTLSELNTDSALNPFVEFNESYVRLGSIFNQSQAGILLNDDALQVLINDVKARLENLSINQAAGYMCTDDIIVDYNASSQRFRIKKDETLAVTERADLQFARYFRKSK